MWYFEIDQQKMIQENYLSLYMHFGWYVYLNGMISSKMISHAWYIFGKFNYFDKKKKSNSAIFPKILTSNYILNQIKLFDNQMIEISI